MHGRLAERGSQVGLCVQRSECMDMHAYALIDLTLHCQCSHGIAEAEELTLLFFGLRCTHLQHPGD